MVAAKAKKLIEFFIQIFLVCGIPYMMIYLWGITHAGGFFCRAPVGEETEGPHLFIFVPPHLAVPRKFLALRERGKGESLGKNILADKKRSWKKPRFRTLSLSLTFRARTPKQALSNNKPRRGGRHRSNR